MGNKMICPKARGKCPLDLGCYCSASVPHGEDRFCTTKSKFCPKCVPVKAKRKGKSK